MTENLTARPDDADVLRLAVKTGRSPAGIAAWANSLTSGECVVETGELVDDQGRGRPAVAALLEAPDALACALLACVREDRAAGSMLERGDWTTLRAVVLGLGASVEDERDYGGFRYARLEWPWSGGGTDDISMGLDDDEPSLVLRTHGEPEWQRYMAAELAESEAPVPA